MISELRELGWYSPLRNSTQLLGLGNVELPELSSAEAHRSFQHRVEHRREIAGRRVDDTKNLGRRRLLFQRLARLIYQPRVLHRDDRLRREVLQKPDLVVGERSNITAIHIED